MNHPVSVRLISSRGRQAQGLAVAVVGAALIALAALLGGCTALRTGAPAPAASAPAVQLTPDEIATAMQQDRFFSDYGGKIVRVQGTVAAVHPGKNNLIVELTTSSSSKVLCNLGQYAGPVHAGDTITVASADVQRVKSGVLLRNCIVV